MKRSLSARRSRVPELNVAALLDSPGDVLARTAAALTLLANELRGEHDKLLREVIDAVAHEMLANDQRSFNRGVAHGRWLQASERDPGELEKVKAMLQRAQMDNHLLKDKYDLLKQLNVARQTCVE